MTFSPTAAGSATGSLTVNAGGVTNTVSLSGTGTAPGPVLSASPASLSFPATLVGSSPATQTVTVTNSGTTAATVSSVAVTGAFSQTNNCTTIAVNGTCTVTVKFTPTAATNTGTLTVNSNANNNPLTVGLSGSGITSTTNIALNKPVTASSDYQSYVPGNVTDGNTSTYWESTDGAAYPQTISVDLGSTQSIGSVTLDLPPSSAWATRTETLSVLGSTNGTSYSQIVGSAGYTFNPSTGNTVTISLPSGTSARYVELSFTGNTGWSAAQLSEFEVFPGGGSTGPDRHAADRVAVQRVLRQRGGGVDQLGAVGDRVEPGQRAVSMTSVGVTGPFAEGNNCGTSLAAGASCTVSVSFAPTAAGAATGTLSVNSSAPGSPLTVALSGTGVSSNTNLALNTSVSASSYTQTYVPPTPSTGTPAVTGKAPTAPGPPPSPITWAPPSPCPRW